MPGRRAFCLVENGRGEILFIRTGVRKREWQVVVARRFRGCRRSEQARRPTGNPGKDRLGGEDHLHGEGEPRQHGQGVRGPCGGWHTSVSAPGIPGREVLRPGQNEQQHREHKKRSLPSGCPRCGSSSVRLRQDPHHKAYRCRSCRRTF